MQLSLKITAKYIAMFSYNTYNIRNTNNRNNRNLVKTLSFSHFRNKKGLRKFLSEDLESLDFIELSKITR